MFLEQGEQNVEDALRRSQRELSNFFENAGIALHWVGPDGIILRVNQAELDMLGYTREEYVGRHIAEFHVDQPVIDDILALLTRGEKLHEFPARLRRKDGRIRDVLINSSVLFENGEFIHTCCFTTDITERQQAEQALRDREADFRAMADNIPQLAWMADGEGWIFWYNRQWFDYTGTTLEQMQGWGWKAVHHPDHTDRVVEKVARHFRDGLYWEDTFPLRGKDGQYRWFLSRMTPIRDEAGRVVRFFGTNTDVTEQRAAEQAAARLAAIVTSSDDAIISKDFNGIITTWNRGAEHLFGYTADEIVGKSVTLLIPADYLNEEPEILARIRRGEPVEHYETVRRRKDGSLVDISLAVSPMRDSAGRIIGASKIARDITERVRLQQQAREQAAELADLHRRKDEFMAMLSHELRNPLAPIANAVHLLRLQKDPDAIQEQARTIIERQVGQLTRLVEDLMEVSRVSTGRVHLDEQHFDLRGIVQRAVETVRPLIAQRRHAITVSLPETPLWVLGDPGRLEQVVVNLLTNAAKYTDEAGHIWLGLEQAGDEAVIRIRDTGIGIAPELLPRIFDLFTQGERALDRSQGGLGVGLALVRQLVQLHRGRVEAQSVVGQGSEFIVRLPAATQAPSARPSTVAPAESTIGRRRVLVVDDNVDSVYSLNALLTQLGHEVATASDGASALEAARAFAPEVILLDIGIPKLNGYEVAARIRSEQNLNGVLLVATTGYGQEVDRQRSREAGFDHHLVKPLDFKKLKELLAKR